MYQYLLQIDPNETYTVKINMSKGKKSGEKGLDDLPELDFSGNDIYQAIITCGIPNIYWNINIR